MADFSGKVSVVGQPQQVVNGMPLAQLIATYGAGAVFVGHLKLSELYAQGFTDAQINARIDAANIPETFHAPFG